jgi:hypothetical protein
MSIYVAHLARYNNQKKRIEFNAEDSDSALTYIAANFPGWTISMFWMFWKKAETF